jgi:hypothetical protein
VFIIFLPSWEERERCVPFFRGRGGEGKEEYVYARSTEFFWDKEGKRGDIRYIVCMVVVEKRSLCTEG